MTTQAPDLILTKEVSDILGESVKNVTRRAQAGELNYVKKFPGVRGAYIFDRADVIAFKKTLETEASVRRTSSDVRRAGAFVVSGDES